MPDRRDYQKGDRIIGATYPANEVPRDRPHIQKGTFLTSTPAAARKHALDDRREDDLIEFDRRHAANIAEIARRLEAVRAQLDDFKKKAK